MAEALRLPAGIVCHTGLPAAVHPQPVVVATASEPLRPAAADVTGTRLDRTAITLAHEGRHAWQSGQPRFTKLQGFERNVRMETDAYAFCARVMDRLGYEQEDVAAQTWLSTKAETDPRVQRFITGDATPEEQSQVLAQMYRDVTTR